MNFVETKESRYDYEYKDDFIEQFGEIFKLDHLRTYSHKIWSICKQVEKSKGIIFEIL